MAKDIPKPTRKPRPPKPAAIPVRDDQISDYHIGLVQERLIGRVVTQWSKLEAALAELLWRFLELSFEDGRLITERMDPSRLIALLRVLAPRKLDGDNLQELSNLLAEADELRDDRNFIIHGTWGTIYPEGDAVSLSLRAKSNPGDITAEHFPHGRMRKITADIIRVKLAVMKIADVLPNPYDDK